MSVTSIVGLVLFICGAICALFSLGYSIYKSVKLVKTANPKIINWKKEVKSLLYFGAANVIGLLLFSLGLYFWQEWNTKPVSVSWSTYNGLDMLALISGAILLAASFFVFINSFIIHYYGKELKEKFNKWLYRSMLIGFAVFILSIFIWTNGFADHLTYPLVNCISFTKGFIYQNSSGGGIAFYALFILGGAVFVFLLCDHKFYKEYGKHGICESTFLVAFPAGIIGARIAYVIGEWNNTSHGQSFAQRVANGEWWSIFAIWEGGLTILGGAIGGIIVGVLWFMWRNKRYSIWLAVDIIVPTILLAQGIGRWGNFFNCEVHGLAVNEATWSWLPKLIYNNIHFSSAHSPSSITGMVFTPLFLIESVINFFGYFVLSYVFGKKLRMHTEIGDLAFGYIIWYGLTRVFMEPLRDSSFVMGKNGYWSWFWSLIFIAVGTLLIVLNHLFRYLVANKKQTLVVKSYWFKSSIIETSIIAVTAIILISVAASLMSTNTFSAKIAFDNYNIGIILLVIGLSVLSTLAISIPHLVSALKARKAI